jgi:hypothetical protein
MITILAASGTTVKYPAGFVFSIARPNLNAANVETPFAEFRFSFAVMNPRESALR